MRLAFVGQGTFFRACSLEGGPVTFIDYRKGQDPGALRAALDDVRPDVVVVFRPETVPPGLLHDLPALTLGFLTEPLPRAGSARHEDLERRLWELEHVDSRNFDRCVAFDPLIVATAQGRLPVWRSVPLPVADRYYRPVTPPGPRPRALFVGRSTPWREHVLTPAKHSFDVLHMAFGVDADDLEQLLADHDVGINVHNHPYPSFENRVCLHLAAGHLVFTEPLSPAHGLELGIDVLEIDGPDNLHHALSLLARFPGMWHGVRLRGRQKAEQFRASRVWPRLLSDLRADVAAFGTARRGVGAYAVARRR